MTKQLGRDEINKKDTWDLEVIYKNNDEFQKDLKKVTKEIKSIENFKGKILESSNSLLQYLETTDKLERKIYKLYYYANLTFDADTTNTVSQELEGKILNLVNLYHTMSSYAIPEMLKTNYKVVLKYLRENEELSKYRFNLEEIYRLQKHSLNEDESRIVASLSKVLSKPSEIYEKLTDSDLTFGNILVDGLLVPLTNSNFSIYIRSSNRDVRKQAFDLFYTTYGRYKNTLSETYNSNVMLLTTMAKLKKFNSSIEASLYNDNISIDIYNNLINTIHDHLDVLYKYYDLKKDKLGIDELHLYDIYTPIVKNYNKSYTFDEAKNIVLEALSVLGEDYINNLKKAFDKRYIDIYNNKGKRSGAYSSGFYDTYPYILLNFGGKYEDVTTLAHELGHSMHTYYSCQNNPYNLSSYNIFVAEVASTVNELLLIKYLINKSTEKKEKLYLVNQLLELYKATIYRQVMFAEFERDTHAMCEKGIILTNEQLSNYYYELIQKYFGKNVVCDDLIKYEWARIPHFYYDFYVYKYAIGLSSATKIVKDILNGQKDSYLEFLKTGGRDYPALELKVANVDVNDPMLYTLAIEEFDSLIAEFKKLGSEIDE